MVIFALGISLFPRPTMAVFALALTLASALAVTPTAMGQPIPAGVVERVQGDALAVQNAQVRLLAPGGDVFVGDILSTGTGSRLEIRMRDEAIFVLGEQTSFVIVDYTFGGGGDPSAVTRLIQGAFLATSGLIAQSSSDAMIVNTPVATIGIRGTTVWGGRMDGFFRVVMLQGAAISVSNNDGRVEITVPEVGTQIGGPGEPPTIPAPWGGDRLARAVASVAFGMP